MKTKRAETSTGKECEPNNWNVLAGRFSATREGVKALNDCLSITFRVNVIEIHIHLIKMRLYLKDNGEILFDQVKNGGDLNQNQRREKI